MLFVLKHPRIHVAGQLPGALRDNAHDQGALAGYPDDTSNDARVAGPEPAPRRLAQNESCCVLAIGPVRRIPWDRLGDRQVEQLEEIVACPANGKLRELISRNMDSFAYGLIESNPSK
jgi:hypothetical protein